MDNETRAQLRATSSSGLIDALLILTHRVHAAREAQRLMLPNPALPGETMVSTRRTLTELREQRELVRAEVERRMQFGYKGPHA